MKNKVYELKNRRAGLLSKAEKALDAKDKAAYDVKMLEIKDINAEIENMEALMAEQGRFNDKGADADKFVTLAAKQAQEKEGRQYATKLETLLASNEYHEAFFNAIKTSAQPGQYNEKLTPLYNAMTESGGTPVGADGGFLVPIDVNNQILEFARAFTNLKDYVHNENVTAPSGWRAVETGKAKTGFVSVDEMEKIPDADTPTFTKLSYAVKKYGGIIEASNELMNDNVANLSAYLARWLARKYALTCNSLIIGKLNTLTASPLADFNSIKKAINVTLDPDISNNAIVLTNQSGFNFLDSLEDSTGRGLLEPNPTVATGKMMYGRRVVMVSNNVLPDVTGKAPVYIGALDQYLTMFNRMGFEMMSTNLAAGAFEHDSVKIRALTRLDLQKVDGEAAVKLEATI